MNRIASLPSLCLVSAFVIILSVLTGCGGASSTGSGPVKPTATCDKSSALLSSDNSYQVKSTETSTENLYDGLQVKIASTNTLDYKVAGMKTVGTANTTDAQQTLTISEVATNPDGTTLQVYGTNVQDSYQVLSGNNFLTYGFSETDTATSPNISTPTVEVIQSTISPALSIPAKPTLNLPYGPETFVSTDLTSLNGGEAGTNVNKNSITRIFSLESVTVSAGTFLACKEVDSTDSVNSTFGVSSHTDSTVWTVSSGPCQGLPLKRVQSHSINGGTSTTSTEETESLSFNGQNCTE
jgi:hypothetical protein